MSPLSIERLSPKVWKDAILLHSKTSFGDYNLPDPKRTIYTGAVYLDDKLVAYGSVPLLAEAVIVSNEELPPIVRAKGIRLLLDEFLLGVEDRPEGIHAFPQDKTFAHILIKRFGFKECKGKALYLEG